MKVWVYACGCCGTNFAIEEAQDQSDIVCPYCEESNDIPTVGYGFITITKEGDQ